MGRNSTNNDSSAVGTEFATVVSPNGFSTGDLVYRSPNGYGVMPDGAVATGSYSVSPTPIDFNVAERSSTVATHYNLGGGYVDSIAAKLTDGNIVVVYQRLDLAYFQIFDVNNTVVVAETSVDPAQGQGAQMRNVSVVALSSGGFIIWWWSQGPTRLYHKGYTNAGAVSYVATNSTQQVAGYNQTSTMLKLYSRSDDRYIALWPNSTTNATFSVYNANGTNYFAPAAFGSGANFDNRATGAVVFSDNSCLLTFSRFTNTFEWFRRNATGAAVTSGTFSMANNPVSAVLLNNGNAALYYFNSSTNLCFRSFNSATNTVGSEVIVSSSAYTSVSLCSAYTIPGTNTNIVFYSWSTGGPYNAELSLCYMVVDGTSGSPVAYGTYPANIAAVMFTSYMEQPTFVQVGSYVRAYFRSIGAFSMASSSGVSTQGSTFYVEVDTTTYATRIFNSVNQASATFTGLPLGTYVKSASTPSTATFLASSNTNSISTTSSTPLSTNLISQTVIDTLGNTLTMRFIQLSTGNILTAYSGSAGQIRFKVYNLAMTQIAYVEVAATGGNGVCPVEFPDGKIGIFYLDGTNCKYKVYSSSFVEVQGVTTVSGINAITSAIPLFDVCALFSSTNQFAIAYRNNSSNYGNVAVCNLSTGSAIYTNTGFATYTITNINVLPLDNGGFTVLTPIQSTEVYISCFVTQSTTWTLLNQIFTSGFTGSVTISTSKFSAMSPTNGIVMALIDNSNVAYFAIAQNMNTGNYASLTTGAYTVPAGGQYTPCAICITATGRAVAIMATNTANQYSVVTSWAAMNSNTLASKQQNTTDAALPSWYNSLQKGVAICPLYGDYVVIGVINSSRYPTFAVVNAGSSAVFVGNAVAGVTQSAPVTIDPSTGFSLVGVAASDCAAGGAGQVQTRGTGVLNSSYPTTSQTFDFTNPVTYGVKGSVSNRVITMED